MRFPVLALMLASVLLLGTPVRGQSAEEIEKLIAQLGDEDADVRRDAAYSLGEIGSKAAPAVPALIAALSDKSYEVRYKVAQALGKIGPKAAPAVPALTAAVSDVDQVVRAYAIGALGKIGPKAAPAVPVLIEALSDRYEYRNASLSLHRIGVNTKAFWWVVPYAYWKQLVGLLLLLAAWFALMARFPKHRPASTPKHLALMAVTAAVPVALACSAVHHAITRDWAQGFLPDAVTLVPFELAAVLSTALVCALPAVWVCQRKKLAE